MSNEVENIVKRNRTAKKKAVEENRIAIQELQQVFGSTLGQRVLFDLLNKFHFLQSNLGNTPEETAYMAGQRSVCSYLLTLMAVTPEQFARQITQSNPGVFETD